ncbi:MAG: efflux RND transporter periplasmic adaptor subunit [Akkermansiaceae bacterium]
MKFYTSPLTLLSALAAISLSSCSEKEQQAQQQPQGPMPVTVAAPIKKSIKLTETYTGRFEAKEQVEIRSRVSGYIDKIHFQEGQEIKEGQPMFSIDPSLFDAEIAIAKARIAQIETSIKLAKSSLTRATSLVAKNAISREELDVRQAEYDQAVSNLKSAQAQLDQSQLNRDYADINAPISGIAGRRLVTRGNYISGGNAGAQVLTSIVAQDPIFCYFEVDERQVLDFTRLFLNGKSEGRDGKRQKVKIAVSDSDEYEFEGEIDFANNTLDEGTATLQLRALVENKNKFLTPGLFARVQIPVGEKQQFILVKESALGFDQDKRFAWVLQPDNTLKKTYVEVGKQLTDLRVVKSGITTEDKIAVGRIQFIRPQTPMSPIDVPMVEEKTLPPAPEATTKASPEKAETVQ